MEQPHGKQSTESAPATERRIDQAYDRLTARSQSYILIRVIKQHSSKDLFQIVSAVQSPLTIYLTRVIYRLRELTNV